MAVLKDEEEQKGQGTSQALAGGVQPQEPQEAPAQPQMGQSSAPATIGGGGTTSPSVKAMPKQQKAGTGTFANLKSYLQAAQGGGRVSQAATQRVQNVAGQAQKGIQKAQETFGAQMGAGSGALFQGTAPGQFLTEEQATQAAQKRAAGVLGTATGTTYQAPQPIPSLTQEQIIAQNEARANLVNVPTKEEPKAPAQPVQQPQQYFKPEDLEAYSNIINAQYQGPQSLQQAGLYEQAARKAQVAQQALQQTQTAAGREQLLRDVYGRNREYTRGQSKLDALLLNASQPAVQSLQQQAQQAGNVQQQLQEAQNLSANEAAQRAAAIQGISSGARGEFTAARGKEEAAANQYIEGVLSNWDKLPEHFKNVLTEAQTKTGATGNKYFDYLVGSKGQGNTYNLSAEESRILGLTPGQGLFGVNPDVIQAAPRATGAEVITKDQLSRQLALSQLAELDKSRGLQKDLLYSDLEKAGTKDILSSLDTQKLRAIQDENRKAMEKELAGKSSSIASWEGRSPSKGSYQAFNWMDILKKGGYTPTEMEGLAAEGQAQNLLRDIAGGQAYSPTEGAANIPGYLQKAYEVMSPTTQGTQLGNWALTPIQSIMQRYGGTDTAQVVEDDKTKARAAALRQLLSDVYKK